MFRNYGGGIIDDPLLCSRLDKSFVHSKIQTKPNHAVLVIGYGKESQELGSRKYFIIKNSFGT